MREYMGLFRGKRIDNGEWVRGFYVRLYDSKGNESHRIYPGYAETDCGDYYPVWYEVDPSTVGECAGLADKNGKLIFEGDIIKIPDDYDEFGLNAGEVYEVYFSFGGFRLKPKYSKARGYWLEDDETVEIIGNIHDNPELLEESNES